MKRDRMKVVLQVREDTERRRLAEQVAADLSLRLASEHHDDAVVALGGQAVPSARSTEGLRQHRLGTLALSDAVERARERERLARREAEAAEQKRVEAAIARRSAERLAERRAAEAAVQSTRAAESQLDAVALETWRRRA